MKVYYIVAIILQKSSFYALNISPKFGQDFILDQLVETVSYWSVHIIIFSNLISKNNIIWKRKQVPLWMPEEKSGKTCHYKFYFLFSFGSKHVSPRTLSARNLGNLVCCEGIVTKCKFFNIFVDWFRFYFVIKKKFTELILAQIQPKNYKKKQNTSTKYPNIFLVLYCRY